MAKFIITREAEDDIDEILAYIALDNFDASFAFYVPADFSFRDACSERKGGKGATGAKRRYSQFS